MAAHRQPSVASVVIASQAAGEALPHDELAASRQHAAAAADILARTAEPGSHSEAMYGAGALTEALGHGAVAGTALSTAHQEITAYVADITGEGTAAAAPVSEVSPTGHAETYAYKGEQAMFAECVAVLEQAAAAGTHTGGKPVDVLVGIELESQIFEDGTVLNLDNLDARIEQMDLDTQEMMRKMARPDGEVIALDDAAQERLVAEGRRAARKYVEAIPAHTADEIARKQRWLEGIDQFGLKEIIHFELYQEFSKPVAHIPEVPADASYEEVAQYGEEHGWVEFRWGPEAGQVGWQDSPGVSEMRLSPCSPTEAVRRKNIVMKRFATIAAKYGMAVFELGEHLNVSAYQQDDGGRGRRMPILGLGTAQRSQTLDALAGLSAGITDGIWLNTSNAQKAEIFDLVDATHATRFTTSNTRTSIRLHTDRVELRDVTLISSVEQGVAWALGGLLAGLHEGHGALAARGYEIPQVEQTHRVLRAPGFVKKDHVDIQRAFEQSERAPDGGFTLQSNHNMHFSQATTQGFLGIELPAVTAYVLNEVIMASMRVEPDGTVYCDAEALRAQFVDLPPIRAEVVHYLAEKADSIAFLATANAQSIRLQSTEVIRGGGAFHHLSPEAREQALRNSPVAQLAFGEGLLHYAADVRRVGEHARATQTPEQVAERLLRNLPGQR